MPFTDQGGTLTTDAWDSVCPIGEYLGGRNWRFSGTAFYVASEGICLTAAHNFRATSTRSSTEASDYIRTPTVIRVLPSGPDAVRIQMVRIKSVTMLTSGLDIAICQAATSDSPPRRLRLSDRWPHVGDVVHCYSCPNTPGNIDNVSGKLAINHTDYTGRVTACFPNGRDRTFLPQACFEIEMDAPGGTSGGPVFNASGHVIGVISTSMAGSPPITYATPVAPILDFKVEFNTDQGPQLLSLRDLAGLRIVCIAS